MVNILSIFLVGALWGCTNPFVKRSRARLLAAEKAAREHNNNSNASVRDKGSSSGGASGGKGGSSAVEESMGALDFLLSLIRHPILALPFAINQLGSLMFYYLLATENVSLVSPLCNSLALAFTALTGYWLGEEYRRPLRMFLGVLCVYAGVFLCSSSS